MRVVWAATWVYVGAGCKSRSCTVIRAVFAASPRVSRASKFAQRKEFRKGYRGLCLSIGNMGSLPLPMHACGKGGGEHASAVLGRGPV